MRAWILVLTVATVIARVPGVAAQPKPLDPETRTKASAHVKQAQEFFKISQWDRALAEYEAAWKLTNEPLMMFNIGLVYDRAGRPEAALQAYQHYLALDPLGQVADEARENVARLAPIADKIRADRAAAESAAAESARTAEEERREKQRLVAVRLAAERRASGAARSSRVYWWGAVGVAVAGGAALALGTKYALDARAADDFISSYRGPWTDEVLARDAAGKSANTRFIVLTSVGGAAVVGAGVLYVMSRRAGTRAERLRLDVAPTAGGAAAIVSGTF